ncbi:ABC transporter ATP-binding protein [Thalassococcus sp. S3]|uniref:ABC transporter ATP-binding protein n=1 Tax=Thalassococcus sp. S3 TaxID=2017482 RepID=UPI001023FBEF|nr:ABC transporter ATP-binding protein [Thalassococcus sp. S3]QBF31082.1 ABC transporter [Thalassococcus sp. S3]
MSISVQRLTKRFGQAAAVDDISFDVAENEFFAIVGASGCGKSTLLRLIAGLEEPTEGRIALEGQVVSDPETFIPPEARQVGFVFQSYALWPHLTVAGNVAFPAEAQGAGKQEAAARAAEHLRTVSLEDYADRRPEALSGGQRQRVALARCLAGGARTILMDEPLANLDPHLRHVMEAELRAFHRRTGTTTVYITHDQREAMALADRMAVMQQGRFLQVGTPHEIYDRPATADVARFIGRGTILPVDLQEGAVRVNGSILPLRAEREGRGHLFVRPAQLDVTSPEGAHLIGQVQDVLYRGGIWEARIVSDAATDPVEVDLHRPVGIGERIGLNVRTGWLLPG